MTRRGSYLVEWEWAFAAGDDHNIAGENAWVSLRVKDINGASVHSTFVRWSEMPQEVAIAVERVEKSLTEVRGL
jgi:hypothetical protein